MAPTKTSNQKEGFVQGIDDVVKILSEAGNESENTKTPPPKEDTIGRLKNYSAGLRQAHTFKTGQLVRWKNGLKNRRTPAYGEPIIVVDVLEEPIFDLEVKSAGSTYFHEPLTLVAGELAPDGDFVFFHYDGRRFEPYEEE